MNAPPIQRRYYRKRHVFDRIAAVLVVLIVLIGLSAVLFPLRSPDRNGGTRAHNLSNLKQSGTALAMYASDHDDRYPVANQWMDSLHPYAKTQNIFRSSYATPKNPFDYGFAFRKEFSLKPLKDFPEPETQVTLFDSTILSRNATSGLETLPKPGRYKGDSEPGNLFGYVDSHVKFIKDKDLATPGADGKPRIK